MILSGWLLFGGQVSWVVEADGQRIRHGGDMMFQGWWWLASSSARMILRSRLAGAAPMPSRARGFSADIGCGDQSDVAASSCRAVEMHVDRTSAR
ncbi:hypothetical protein [Saccharothrix sp. NRRL B-16314]|uniref:hypothetical protein n=1 Tax=Saccharothrix sp. NRRL B-16314 TaxID=1463825 RepID=UPI000527CE5C|nr:hypothetical protein [Saccharothrix sp. NRRL B-16314]